MAVQNVVFDIGNVFIRWDPLANLEIIFPDHPPELLWEKMRPAWLDLKRGRKTLEETLNYYHATLKLPQNGFRLFCDKIMSHATLFQDTLLLQARLETEGIPLYCISDNIKEVIEFYRKVFTFMQRFRGVVISAEVDLLKPDPMIFECLFDRYKLDPETCVFFDDVQANVDGAKQVGMSGFVFTDAATCERDLHILGFRF